MVKETAVEDKVAEDKVVEDKAVKDIMHMIKEDKNKVGKRIFVTIYVRAP